MSALCRFAVACALALAAMPAEAQIRGRDGAGYPVRSWVVRLRGGKRYTFSTDTTLGTVEGAPRPNAVLSLRRLGVRGRVQTVAGSWDCPGFGVQPSCFSYYVPARAGGDYVLTLRAWRTETPGRTNVWYQERGSEPISLTPLGPVTFGGGTYTTTLTGSRARRRIHLHTRLRPGNNTHHTILAYERRGEEFRIVYGQVANGRVGDTAMIDEESPVGAGLTGPLTIVFGGTEGEGPIELFENDWFVAGADADGDGLGRALEQSLRTCDRVTDPEPSPGFSCARLRGCPEEPSSPLCVASLRDTDHDGLRDDLELYGYDDPLLHIPLWGADPAHMDIFVELDAEDQDERSGCQGFDIRAIDAIGGREDNRPLAPFFDRLADIWGQAPARLNPDGQPGIRFHYDVGVRNPNPRDDRWGAWGGGNTCLPPRCNYLKAYKNEPPCAEDTFARARRWVFGYVVDADGGGGQTAGLSSVAGDASHHVHELGHQLHLGHAGPQGSAGEASNDFGNGRPSYPSRMNYLYQDYGGTAGQDDVRWRRIAFSSGLLVTPVSGIDAPEIRPFAPHTFFAEFFPDVRERISVDGGVDVDWNQDGRYEGRSYMKVWGQWQRIQRWSRVVPPGRYVAATSATTAGPFLVHAYVDEERRPTLRIDGNADCNDYPFDVRSVPRWHPDFLTAGSYPGCFRPGVPIRLAPGVFPGGVQAAGLAVAGIWIPGRAGLSPGLLAVINNGGFIEWAEIELAPSPRPEEAAFRAAYGGVVASNVRALVDLASSTPSLVSLTEPVSDPVLGDFEAESSLLVIRAEGPSLADPPRLVQASRQPLQPRLPPSWVGFQPVLDLSGDPIESNTAVGLTTLGSRILMATAVDQTIQIWELVREGREPLAFSRWQQIGTLFATTPVRHRPTIVAAPDRDAPGHRLWVLYTHDPRDVVAPGGQYLVLRISQLNDFSRFGGEIGFYGNQPAYGSPAAVWDERPNLLRGHADVRVWRHVVLSPDCLAPTDCGSGQVCVQPPALPDGRRQAGRCAWPENLDPIAQQVELAPFARGPAPGYYTDYDEWRGLQWGICERRAEADPDAPDEYRDRGRCGTVPMYPEPMPGGAMAIVREPPANDRELHPWLYEDRGIRD